MKRFKTTLLTMLIASASVNSMQAGDKWNLSDCLKYAKENNITLQKKRIALEESKIDVKTAKAALFPSLSFSTNQNVAYRPFSESTTNLTSGSMTVSNNKTNYNGSYGLNAQWTIYNGGKNTKNIKRQQIAEEIASNGIDESSNSIQEEITKLYVQILYSSEAVNVNKQLLETSKTNYERGEQMVEVGLLSKSELAQLEAQVSQDNYNVVNAESTLENYILQLKQLLELGESDNFEVSTCEFSDSQAMSVIPSKAEVYSAALQNRPEILSSKLSVENADLAVSIAKAGYLPTLSLSAGIGSSNSSGQKGISFTEQMRKNMNNSIGATLSIPIFNNRETKSAVEKAKLERVSSSLDLQEQQKKLYSTIATLWLDANSAQKKYVAATANTKSTQSSFDLINEQFRLGLKNIVELAKSKDELINAKQNELQSKYTAVLDIQLLKFYSGESINL